jgi:hypothetical protein
MALAFSVSSLVLFLLNTFSAFPQDFISGLSAGLGIAGGVLGLAGYKIGRRED